MALWNLLLNWWRKDRVRAANYEGRLLRLEVHDQFLYDHQIWTVVERWTVTNDEGAMLTLKIRGDMDAEMYLKIHVREERYRPQELVWLSGAEGERVLSYDDIVVLRRRD